MESDYQRIRKQWNPGKKEEIDDSDEYDYCEIHKKKYPATLDCPKCKCGL